VLRAGADGAVGMPGQTGEGGETGPRGPIGPTGQVGAPGGPGVVGAQGGTGAPGPAGFAGATGVAGEIGPAGPRGAMGKFRLICIVSNKSVPVDVPCLLHNQSPFVPVHRCTLQFDDVVYPLSVLFVFLSFIILFIYLFFSAEVLSSLGLKY